MFASTALEAAVRIALVITKLANLLTLPSSPFALAV